MTQSNKRKRIPPVPLRLTPEEIALLNKKAEAEGQSRNAYIRERLFCERIKGKRRENSNPVRDKQALSQILGLLASSKMANNLNQLAYRANIDSLLLTPEVEATINGAYEEIQLIRQLLMKALGYRESRLEGGKEDVAESQSTGRGNGFSEAFNEHARE